MPEVSGSNRPSMEPLDIPEEAWTAAEKEMEAVMNPAPPEAEPEAVAEPAAPVVEPETPAAPEPVKAAEPEPVSASQTIENVLAELEAIKAKLPEPEVKAPEPPPIPEAIQAALDHDDPVVQNLGKYALEQLGYQQKQIAVIADVIEQQQIERNAEHWEPLIEAACEKFDINEKEEKAVTKYMMLPVDPKQPDGLQWSDVITYDEGIQRVYPGRQPKAAAPLPPPPVPPTPRTPQPGQPLPAGAAAAPPPRTTPVKKDITIEEFVDDGFAKLNWR